MSIRDEVLGLELVAEGEALLHLELQRHAGLLHLAEVALASGVNHDILHGPNVRGEGLGVTFQGMHVGGRLRDARDEMRPGTHGVHGEAEKRARRRWRLGRAPRARRARRAGDERGGPRRDRHGRRGVHPGDAHAPGVLELGRLLFRGVGS